MIIFYVFWDEESENRTRFHPIHLDFALPESGHFFNTKEPWKIIFRKQVAIIIVLTIFYVFLDEESDSGIRFYPPRPDFAVPDEAIFLYDEEFLHPVYQNLDVVGKNRCRNRIPRPKKHRKRSKL